jgi:hypothetical protein
MVDPFGLQIRASFYDEVVDFIIDLYWAPSTAMFYDEAVDFVTNY